MPEAVRAKMAATKQQLANEQAVLHGYKEDRICEECKKIFPRPANKKTGAKRSWFSYLKMRFCSTSCMAKARERGWGHSTAELKCAVCKKLYFVRGKRKEFSQCCSRKCLGILNGERQEGAGHWNWKGGKYDHNKIRRGPEYKAWREAVLKRDQHTCQLCGEKEDILAHHIKPIETHPDLALAIDNGQTLCRGCHKKHHKEIGSVTQFKKKSCESTRLPLTTTLRTRRTIS